jgi:chromate reductase, NAD(P)H dehydrogenase (quinone)
MSSYKIAVIIGSLRRDAYNKQLANAVKRLGPKDFSFEDLRIDDLPLYSQDDARTSRNRSTA